ncbi:MAG: hypothetical protein Q9198_009976, partial [Flavoplaca austrocitrina]
DFPHQYQLVEGADIGFEDIIPGERYDPYDPHDPQNPPYTEGYNYATKEGAREICSAAIDASFSEVMFTNDPSITHEMLNPLSQWAVALKPRPARLAGLVSPRPNTTYIYEWSFWFRDSPPQPGEVIHLNAIYEWSFWFRDSPPQPGEVIHLNAQYDWDSPRWPRPGVIGPFPGPTASLTLAAGISRGPDIRSSQHCVRHELGRRGLGRLGANTIRGGTKGADAAR